jgi:hypothetical protein
LLLQVLRRSVERHDSESPVLRQNNIPEKYRDRFMSLSLHSGKEMAQEISEIIERMKSECNMNEQQIEEYLQARVSLLHADSILSQI